MVDIISYAAGFGSGVAATGIGYGIRRLRMRRNERGETQIQEISRSMRRSADRRYMEDFIPYMMSYHMAGKLLPLSDILMQPKVLIDIDEHDFDLEEKSPIMLSTSNVIPRMHDFPQVYAAFNLESMDMKTFINGDRHVALLGMPGTGKTTALVTLALMAAQAVEFEDVVEFEEEQLAELTDKERAELEEQYENLQKAALNQLREIRRSNLARVVGEEEAEEADISITSTDIHDLFPIFFHIGNIDVDMNLYGVQVDPAEPVIHAIQQYLSAITAQVAPVMLYRHLDAGECLVLIDGYDDLSAEDRARVFPWLQSFIDNYGHNRIVISGPATGYDPLLALGCTPAFIAPPTVAETNKLIEKWYEAWQALQPKKKKDDEQDIDQALVNRLLTDNRNRSYLELTMKTWTALAGDERELGRRGWFERYVRTHAPEDDHGPVVLREIAKVLLDRGEPLKEEQLIEVATSRTEADGDVMKNPESFIKGLRDRGLLIQQAGGTYTFRHPMITAYLGGESLIHDMEHRLDEVATQPAWDMALGFAAAVIDMLPAVKARLSAEADVLYDNLFSIAHWLPESDPNATWRGEILKRVSAAIVATSQFPTVRKRALASLVASRDRNVIFIMRQAIRHANPVIRALACVGLGAIGSTDGIRDLRSMVVDDDRDVQMAAAQSLGAIGTDAALEVMVQALLEGDENLRQAIAEALSAVPGEGYEILRDAIDHQDMMVRRAAVFGLARVPTMWALGALYRTMLEDSQWYVRSAAERVFTDVRDPERQGPQGPPPLDDLTWLRQWAASQGEGIPDSDAASQLLIRALQQGDQPKVRELAAKALAQQSHTSSVKPLYAALRDKEETVRAEAYEALGTLQMRSTKSLPGIA